MEESCCKSKKIGFDIRGTLLVLDLVFTICTSIGVNTGGFMRVCYPRSTGYSLVGEPMTGLTGREKNV